MYRLYRIASRIPLKHLFSSGNSQRPAMFIMFDDLMTPEGHLFDHGPVACNHQNIQYLPKNSNIINL